MFTKKELKNAIIILNDHPECENIVEDLLLILCRSEKEEVVLIDKNALIGSILWDKTDIEIALETHQIKPTKENVNKVINNLNVKLLENCEYGWEVIHTAIHKAFLWGGR